MRACVRVREIQGKKQNELSVCGGTNGEVGPAGGGGGRGGRPEGGGGRVSYLVV